MDRKPLEIGILVFPDMTHLDAMGPAQVLALVPGARLHLVWKTTEPVRTEAGFCIVPTVSFADCPPLDVLCVPGGTGQSSMLTDAETLAFLRTQGEQAKYVTSVCSGSLVLGAAGLLKGYRAASHWMFRDLLSEFGATPVAERVVRDRNRITGGGVTAGVDFGFVLAAEIAGESVARRIQLLIEYDPKPPFEGGTPERSRPEDVARTRDLMQKPLAAWTAQVARAAANLKQGEAP